LAELLSISLRTDDRVKSPDKVLPADVKSVREVGQWRFVSIWFGHHGAEFVVKADENGEPASARVTALIVE